MSGQDIKEKDISTCSIEELQELAKIYGVDDDSTIETIQLDALVALKIIKHCKENLPELVTGQLLGINDTSQLKVTNCFPFPARGNEANELEDRALADYQIEMLKGLREVNVDNNTVGWYTSTYCSILSDSVISDQFKYQNAIDKCVVIVYDHLKTAQGELSFRAFRLTSVFMDLYKKQAFTQASLAQANLSFTNIFEEIPVRIHNSGLMQAFLLEVQDNETCIDKGCDFDRLDLATNPFLEANLEFLIETADRLAAEQTEFQYYQRSVQRQQNAINKRKQAGESTEEIMASMRAVQEPSQKNTLFMLRQMDSYCGQMKRFAAQSFDKLYLLEGLHFPA